METGISDKLRRIRDERGLSQEELARRLNVSFPTVNSWERGKSQPYPRHQHAIDQLYQEVVAEAGGQRVLIAEDDEAAALILADYVAMALPDWEVVSVANGYDAILQIGLLKPTIVLLDIMMPDIDGLQVLHRLQNMEELKDTRVILVTAVTDETILQAAREAKPFALIQKPVEPRRLVDTLREAATAASTR